MKHAWFAFALAAAWLPTQAVAMCYTVLGPSAVVVWRGTNTPIDLSKPVSVGMRETFPAGNILVISDQTAGCTPIGPQNFFGDMPGLTGPVPGVPDMRGGMTASGSAR